MDQVEQPAEADAAEHGLPQDTEDQKQMDVLTDNFNWQAFKLKMKQKLKVWACSEPGAVLLVVALAMKLLLGLVHRLLSKGSKDWERSQKADAAAGEPRTFVILEAARMTDLLKFREEVNVCFHTHVLGIPRREHIYRHQVLLFRMLSASACSAEFYITTSWRGFPVQLFASLDGKYSVAEARKCLLCPLSEMILSNFPTDELLASADCQALLIALASTYSLDISDLESKHASTRRINRVRSVQAQRSQLVSVSADWACRCNATQREDLLPSDPKKPKAGKPDEAKKKQRRANPWNAFLSEHCKQQFKNPALDLTELSQQFRNLAPEERQKYTDMAKIAERHIKEPYGDRSRKTETCSSLVEAEGGVHNDLQESILQAKKQQASVLASFREETAAAETAIQEYSEDSAHLSSFSRTSLRCYPPTRRP